MYNDDSTNRDLSKRKTLSVITQKDTLHVRSPSSNSEINYFIQVNLKDTEIDERNMDGTKLFLYLH